MPEQRPTCFCCGRGRGSDDLTYGAQVPEESFRQGTTPGRFILSALLLTPIGINLLRAGLAEDEG